MILLRYFSLDEWPSNCPEKEEGMKTEDEEEWTFVFVNRYSREKFHAIIDEYEDRRTLRLKFKV